MQRIRRGKLFRPGLLCGYLHVEVRSIRSVTKTSCSRDSGWVGRRNTERGDGPECVAVLLTGADDCPQTPRLRGRHARRCRAHSGEHFNEQVSATNRCLLNLRGEQVRVQGFNERRSQLPEQSLERDLRPSTSARNCPRTCSTNKLVQSDRGIQPGEGEKEIVDRQEGGDER